MQETSYTKSGEAKCLGVLTWIVIIIVSAYRLYVLYFPFKLFGYLVPPGSDPVNHYEMVAKVLAGDFNVQYPLLFHALVAFFSKLLSVSPLVIMKFAGLLLVVLPPIAIYLFLKNQYGRLVGLVGFALTGLASNYGLLAFADGNYPNMLSGGVFMPIALMFLVQAVQTRGIKNYIWGILIGLLMVLTHQLTVVLFVLILIVYLIVLWIWNAYSPIFKGLKQLSLFTCILLVAGTIIVFLSPVKGLFAKVFSSVFAGGFVDDVAYLKPIGFSEYQHAVGSLVWTGGLISIVYLIFLLGKNRNEENKATLLLILVWFAVCFALSRMSQTGMPGRFARELAIPLIMAMAIAMVSIIRQNEKHIQRVLAGGFFVFVIVLNLVQVNGGAFAAPDYFNSMIWFGKQDKEKADFIKLATAKDDIIISNRTTPYMPIFADRQIIFYVDDYLKKQTLKEYINSVGADYLLIGQKTIANPDEKVYPFFKGFDATTALLKEFVAQNHYPIVHIFADGTVLYKL